MQIQIRTRRLIRVCTIWFNYRKIKLNENVLSPRSGYIQRQYRPTNAVSALIRNKLGYSFNSYLYIKLLFPFSTFNLKVLWIFLLIHWSYNTKLLQFLLFFFFFVFFCLFVFFVFFYQLKVNQFAYMLHLLDTYYALWKRSKVFKADSQRSLIK